MLLHCNPTPGPPLRTSECTQASTLASFSLFAVQCTAKNCSKEGTCNPDGEPHPRHAQRRRRRQAPPGRTSSMFHGKGSAMYVPCPCLALASALCSRCCPHCAGTCRTCDEGYGKARRETGRPWVALMICPPVCPPASPIPFLHTSVALLYAWGSASCFWPRRRRAAQNLKTLLAAEPRACSLPAAGRQAVPQVQGPKLRDLQRRHGQVHQLLRHQRR